MSVEPLTIAVAVCAEPPDSEEHTATDALDRILIAEALGLARSRAGSQVVALSVGAASQDGGLRRCLAAGAHRSIRLSMPEEACAPESVAIVMASAARALGAKLLVCGQRRGSDGTGRTGYLLAAGLGAPIVNDVVALGWGRDGATVAATQWAERGDRTVLEARLPAVLLLRPSVGRPLYLAVSRERRFALAQPEVHNVDATALSMVSASSMTVEVIPARARVKKTPGAARAKTMTAAERRAAMRGGGAKSGSDSRASSGPMTGDADMVARGIADFLSERGLV